MLSMHPDGWWTHGNACLMTMGFVEVAIRDGLWCRFCHELSSTRRLNNVTATAVHLEFRTLLIATTHILVFKANSNACGPVAKSPARFDVVTGEFFRNCIVASVLWMSFLHCPHQCSEKYGEFAGHMEIFWVLRIRKHDWIPNFFQAVFQTFSKSAYLLAAIC